ncbi:MAG: radical SAM protein [Candidatus Omnitrophica bacterium]|nr:radical SAM protein [Candidatus Omnitrophota bacterium]
MKVLFTYFPHYSPEKGYLLLSQNRFTKYRGDPELIYPLIPASALTLLKNDGHQVFFLDGIVQRLSLSDYLATVKHLRPDILFFETKTPCVQQDWRIVQRLKEILPGLLIGCCGDHVSVLPEETLNNSPTDFVILGGDYDEGIRRLCQSLSRNETIPAGVAYRERSGRVVNPGKPIFVECLDELPFIDREIVPWKNYHEAWRLYDQFAYLSGSRGCPYRCTFCSWPQMLYQGRVRFRSPAKIAEEMRFLVNRYGIKEFFFDDDTFTCNRPWVLEICDRIRNLNLPLLWSCNGRVDNVDALMLQAMKESGCRLIKYGVESVHQITLDRIKKGYTVEQVREAFRLTQKAGILIHATAMLGFPWETKEQMRETVRFIEELRPDTCQFSLPIAYPGTELFAEAKKNGWLSFGTDWQKYDMSLPTLKHPDLEPREIVAACRQAWLKVYFSPTFLLKKAKAIYRPSQVRWYWRGLFSLLKGHLASWGKI